MAKTQATGGQYDEKDPYFDPVRNKRMSELTQAQQDDARELWLIQQLAWMQEYYRDHLVFLLNRVAGLRAELAGATRQQETTMLRGGSFGKSNDAAPDVAHRFHQRDDGLFHCQVCDGAEASLPTECPRQRMTGDQENAVERGVLDFVGGQWVAKCKVLEVET